MSKSVSPRVNENFGAMLQALDGVTVLEKPRVSRETIISVLRDHTINLQSMKQELHSTTNLVKILAEDAADSRKQLASLEDGMKNAMGDITSLVSKNNELREDMDMLRTEVEALNDLRVQLKAQGTMMENLSTRFETHKTDMAEFIEKTTEAFESSENRLGDLQFQLRTLKDYVDHFGDNLVLASCQITVEASAGFSSRPISLLDVLKQCNGSLLEVDKTLSAHGEELEKHTQEIETKADGGVVLEVENLGTRTKAIEKHLKSEEEQGVNAIRRMCEELTVSVESIISDLSDKVDRSNVEIIVHKKYEDIVQYLQEALTASAADEENFKQKANELIEAMAKLSNSKADRIELSPIQESLVKTEAMLTKFLAQNKEKEKLDKSSKETWSKKEIEALLQLKVDKEEFEQQIQLLLKGVKRQRKLTAVQGGVPELHDDAAYLTELPSPRNPVPGGGGAQLLTTPGTYNNPLLMSASTGSLNNPKAPGGGGNKPFPQKMSLQQHHQQQQMQQMYQDQMMLQQQMMQMRHQGGGGGPGSGGDGGSECPQDGGQSGFMNSVITGPDLQQPSVTALPAGGRVGGPMGTGVKPGGGGHVPGTMPKVQPSPQNDVSAALSNRFVDKTRAGVSGASATGSGGVPSVGSGKHSAAMNFPSNNPAQAGQFRGASEGGVAGGVGMQQKMMQQQQQQQQQQPNSPINLFNVTGTTAPISAPHNNNQQGTARALGAEADEKAFMIKGRDGHFYYTDAQKGGAGESASAGSAPGTNDAAGSPATPLDDSNLGPAVV